MSIRFVGTNAVFKRYLRYLAFFAREEKKMTLKRYLEIHSVFSIL